MINGRALSLHRGKAGDKPAGKMDGAKAKEKTGGPGRRDLGERSNAKQRSQGGPRGVLCVDNVSVRTCPLEHFIRNANSKIYRHNAKN